MTLVFHTLVNFFAHISVTTAYLVFQPCNEFTAQGPSLRQILMISEVIAQGPRSHYKPTSLVP